MSLGYIHGNLKTMLNEKEVGVQLYGSRVYTSDFVEDLLSMPQKIAKTNLTTKKDVTREINEGSLDVYTQVEVSNQVYGNMRSFDRDMLKTMSFPKLFMTCNPNWNMNVRLGDGSWMLELESNPLHVDFKGLQMIRLDLTDEISGDEEKRNKYAKLISEFSSRYGSIPLVSFENDILKINLIGAICLEISREIATHLPFQKCDQYASVRTMLEMPFKKFKNEIHARLNPFFIKSASGSLDMFLQANKRLQSGDTRQAIYNELKQSVKNLDSSMDTGGMRHFDGGSSNIGGQVSPSEYINDLNLEEIGIKAQVGEHIVITFKDRLSDELTKDMIELVAELNERLEEPLIQYDGEIISFELMNVFAAYVMKNVDGTDYEEIHKEKISQMRRAIRKI